MPRFDPFFSLILLLVGVVACKEPVATDNSPVPQAASVLIGGHEYPVLTIGNRVWTTANHDGPGGLLYKGGTEKPEHGRYYTFEEVKAIIVPNGWRIPTMQD